MIKILVFAVFIALASCHQENYDNFKVYRILPTTVEQNALLHEISMFTEGYSFWNGPGRVNATVDLMVSPQEVPDFENLMSITGTKYQIYIDNVQKLIENENPERKLREKVDESEFDWTRYHTLDEIYNWLDSLAEIYPDNIEIIVGGSTYEGREIKGVKLSFNEGNPGVFIEGNIHAREWITSATVTYILNEFLTSVNPEIRELAESNDWYIFPVFNPDGFVYSHTKDRMWRKTTKPYSFLCRGADPNRNWGFKWNDGGDNSSPCSETNPGFEAFSEIEAKSMSEYIESISDKFYAYISFHSYSQLLLLPYGHTTDHLDNYDELLAIGNKTIEALSKRYGTKYVTGNIAETIYIATGTSMDWVKAQFQPPISFTYELRDKGTYGFLLPAKQIISTGEETLDSLIAMFKEARERGIPERK